jgi:hypothetical protein
VDVSKSEIKMLLFNGFVLGIVIPDICMKVLLYIHLTP